MHTTGTTCLRVQSGLKDSAKDGRTDEGPVEVVGGTLENQRADLLIDAGYLNIAGKHSAVHIREGQQFLVLVRVAVLRLLVQDAEQFDKFLPEFPCTELRASSA